MRILYITHKPIYPVIDGGCKAMQQFLNCLVNLNFEINHVCLSTHKHPFLENEYPKELSRLIDIENISIDTTIKISQVLKHLILKKSYNVSRFDVNLVHEKLSYKIKNAKYDFVVLESLYCTPYINTIRENSNAKIVLRSHNVEFNLWEQLSKNSKGFFKRYYLRKLAEVLKKYELNAYSKVDQIFSITDSDRDFIQSLGVRSKIHTIPVAMDQRARNINDSLQRICFIGSMNWQPNKEAVEKLTQDIFPKVRKKAMSTELHLAGSYMNGQYPTDLANNIINHGFAENMDEFLRSNGLMVLPILSGSGVRVKILEALSLGIPIVTTPIGAMGITDPDTVIIAKSEEEIVEMTLKLLKSPEKRKHLGNKAWNYIFSNYSIDKVSIKISSALHE